MVYPSIIISRLTIFCEFRVHLYALAVKGEKHRLVGSWLRNLVQLLNLGRICLSLILPVYSNPVTKNFVIMFNSDIHESISQRIFLFPLFYICSWKRNSFFLPYTVLEYMSTRYSFSSIFFFYSSYEHKGIYKT